MRARRWWPRDGRRGSASSSRSGRLQAASVEGVSLYVRPESGNEASLIGQSLEWLRELSGGGGLLILDSACGQPKMLCQIARADLRFNVALRARPD